MARRDDKTTIPAVDDISTLQALHDMDMVSPCMRHKMCAKNVEYVHQLKNIHCLSLSALHDTRSEATVFQNYSTGISN